MNNCAGHFHKISLKAHMKNNEIMKANKLPHSVGSVPRSFVDHKPRVLKFDFALSFTDKKPFQYLWGLVFPNISPCEILINEIGINQLAIIGESCKIVASEDSNIPFLTYSCAGTELAFFFSLLVANLEI